MGADPPRRLSALRFRWSARFGFFLRAEASVAGLTYPVPPRTAVLGAIANIIGLEKDALATELADARISISGVFPRTHWHCGNYRKVPPAPLGYRVKRTGKPMQTRPEKNTRLRQEWLIAPSFEVVAVLPEPHHGELHRRLESHTSYFTPCMGLSEMLANVEFVGEESLDALDLDNHSIMGPVRIGEGIEIDTRVVQSQRLHAISFSMPRSVTKDRSFERAVYFVERQGKALPFRTGMAWQGASGALVFL